MRIKKRPLEGVRAMCYGRHQDAEKAPKESRINHAANHHLIADNHVTGDWRLAMSPEAWKAKQFCLFYAHCFYAS